MPYIWNILFWALYRPTYYIRYCPLGYRPQTEVYECTHTWPGWWWAHIQFLLPTCTIAHGAYKLIISVYAVHAVWYIRIKIWIRGVHWTNLHSALRITYIYFKSIKLFFSKEFLIHSSLHSNFIFLDIEYNYGRRYTCIYNQSQYRAHSSYYRQIRLETYIRAR